MAKQRPAFKGLLWNRSQHFSFFRPNDWHEFQWAEGHEGVIFGPDAEDPLTVLAVELSDLGMTTTPDDHDDLNAGFMDGIRHLPGCEIDEHETWVQGSIICLSARYTYLDEDARRKRWVRAFYQDNRQIVMTAQGATVEAFDYWLPMFYECMMTTRIHRFAPQTP